MPSAFRPVRFWVVLAAVLLVPWAATPASAQSDEPMCEPATCDPVTANDGEVRAGDEPVRVILFAHPDGLLQHTPVNMEPPSQEEEDVNEGFLMPTVYTDAEEAPCCKFRNNRFIWFGSPGPVEFLEGGDFRVYQEPGFGAPLDLAGDEVTVFLYLSPGRSTPAGPSPAAMPAVGVYARLVEGRHATEDPAALVAMGDTGSGYGDPEAKTVTSTTTMVSLPGEDPVYEFRVPMHIVRHHVPSVHDAVRGDRDRGGVTLELIVYQVEDNETVRLTDSQWRLRSGPHHPPRIVWDMHRPLQTADSWIHTANGDLFFRWSVRAVFGSYDIDPASVRLDVDGPVPVDPDFLQMRYSVDHDGHFKPANATWRHDLADEPLADGTYWVHASVMNLQGTYQAEWNASFEVKDGWPQVRDVAGTRLQGTSTTPALDGAATFVALLVGLAVVAAGRRRGLGGA